MTFVSSALLAHITVSPSQLASDSLLELMLLQLISPLQVKVQQTNKAVLSMTLSDQIFTQRNVILKTLVGIIGLKQNQHGRPLLSHPTTPISSAGLTAWMSVADSVRHNHTAVDLLANLDTHLQANAFLLPTSHTTSLADLDLALELMNHQLEACEHYVHVARWLSTSHAMLTQLGCKNLPVMQRKTSLVSPLFFNGTEDEALVFKTKTAAPPAKNAKSTAQAQSSTKTNQQQPDASTKASQGELKKKDKQSKQAKPQQQQAPEAATVADANASALDIRVGKILKAWHHPEAEKLFCEEIDLGNGEVRQIASGLRPFYQTEDLVRRSVVVLCNLKKRNLVGFGSHGMVLCASNADHTVVKFVVPPGGVSPGDRVVFGDLQGEPEPESKVAKKKIFEKLAPDLKTTSDGKVVWKDHAATVGGANVTAELNDAQVS